MSDASVNLCQRPLNYRLFVAPLDYFLARYYSSTQGRFSSPDQLFADQEEDDPQSWNLYSFVRNDPLRYVDPFGDAAETPMANWVGDADGECSKEMGACWRVDSKKELGGYWDFGGDQAPVTVRWTHQDEAALQAAMSKNLEFAERELDVDCDECAYEAGGGRLIAQGLRALFTGGPTSRLDKAMRARGVARYIGTHAHHIVAQGARNASQARKILRRFRIDVDSAENGVYLSKQVHQGLHTNAYYAKVERLLSAAATREEAVAILSYIGSQLQKGTFISKLPKAPF